MRGLLIQLVGTALLLTTTLASAQGQVSPTCQVVYLTQYEAKAKACPGFLSPAEEDRLGDWIDQMAAFAVTGDPTSRDGVALAIKWREAAAGMAADSAGYGDRCLRAADDSDGARSYIDFIMSEEGDRWLAEVFSHPGLHDSQMSCL